MVSIAQTESINPATGEVIGTSDLNDAAEVRNTVTQGRQAQQQWSQLPIRERVAYLRRIRDYLTLHADEMASIISKDNGKTRIDALATEVLPAAMAVDYYCRKARSFLTDRRLMPSNWLMANKSSKIIRVPFGVVGIISPWNYPFSIPFSEVVMALLAGNSVLLKTATETQQVGRALERSMAAAGLPPGVFTYLNLPKVKKNFWWHPHGPAIYNGLRGLLDFLYADGIWPRLKGLAKLMRVYPRTFFESNDR